MLYATNIFPGDNVTKQYELTFVGGYIDRDHVKAYFEDNLSKVQTPIDMGTVTWLGPYTARLATAAPAGTNAVFLRETPRAPLVDFQGSSRITEANLDLAHKQGLFVAVESLDSSNSEVVNQLKDVIIGVQAVAEDALASAAASEVSAVNSASSAGIIASQASQSMSSATAANTAKLGAQAARADALTYRNAAEGFKNAAGTSATTSGTSEANALAYRNSASGYATTALGHANAGSIYASAALASQNAAAGSASTATTQASNANTSAGWAATYAGNANTSAGQASTYAANSSTFATISQTQAGIATTKAAEAVATAAGIAALPVWNPTRSPTNRNLIINPTFSINERGLAVVYGGHITDRWIFDVGGITSAARADLTALDFPGNRQIGMMAITVTAAKPTLSAGDFIQVRQNIEALDQWANLGLGKAGAKPITVSFWTKATRVGQYSASLRAPSEMAARSCVLPFSVTTANVWQKVVLTFPADTADMWPYFGARTGMMFTLNAGSGSSYTTASGAWQNGTYVSRSGSLNLCSVLDANIVFTQIQLEEGPVATPFDVPDTALERIKCQRYFSRMTECGVVQCYPRLGIAHSYASFPVKMRAAPVVNVIQYDGAVTSAPVASASGFYFNSDRSNSWGYTADAEINV